MSINKRAKATAVLLVDMLSYNVLTHSSPLISTFGIILNNIMYKALLPAVTWAFSKSNVLSAAFLGITEGSKFIVKNLIQGKADFKAGAAALSATLSGFGKSILTQFKLIFTSLTAALKTFSFNVKYTTAQMIASLGLTDATKKVGTKLQSGFVAMFASLGLFFKTSIAKLGAGVAAAVGAFAKTVAGVATGIVSATGLIALAAGFTLAAAWDTLFDDGERNTRFSSKII